MKVRAITVPLLLAAVGAVGATAAQGAAAPHHTYTAKLSGSAEVPKKASPGAGGSATVTLTGAKVCWKFHLTGVAGAAAAHIHAGAAGAAGAVVIPLGGTYKATGCTTTTAALAKKIVAGPGKFYVNVHNKEYAAGAARGQL